MQSAAPGVPAQVKIGRRVESFRRGLPVRPTVLIVQNGAAYAAAIGKWSVKERWPVLIDDGSDRAREDIARFVRAFQPKTVLCWDGATADGAAIPPADDPTTIRAAVLKATWAAWGAQTNEEMYEVWTARKWDPVGIVVASPSDPAWTAALALAVGRGQFVMWVESKPEPLGNVTILDNVKAMSSAVTGRLEELGRPWRETGDQIEAVTLCLNTATRVTTEKGQLALTDLIGRHADGTRWGWCGIVPGSESQAAYRAMCALFLQPNSAWLFDGYKEDFAPPYALPKAKDLLEKAGFKVASNFPPSGGARQWRQRTAWGMSADLIHVNTSGNNDFFDLTPGRGYGSDVPLLERPSIVHFIHSYSAQVPQDASTIAGRFLENGAYAYLGSMDEPFLGAFFPAETWVSRFLSGAPFGVAVRQDTQPPWKLNVFGDPLVQVGAPSPRLDDPPTIEGAVNAETVMQGALKQKQLARGAMKLVMLGRDETVAKLALAALDAQPSAMTAELARIALLPTFRRGDKALFMRLFFAMTQEDQQTPLHADLLWSVAREDLGTTSDDKLLSALRLSVRRSSMAEDAAELAPALKRVFGENGPRSMIAALLDRAPDESTKKKLQELGGKY
jgi:hypothetical protein